MSPCSCYSKCQEVDGQEHNTAECAVPASKLKHRRRNRDPIISFHNISRFKYLVAHGIMQSRYNQVEQSQKVVDLFR